MMATLHEALKPLSWLLGRWATSTGACFYPTIKDFKYADEMEFFHVGQPNIQFSMLASNPETKAPMHREVGFIRIKPGTTRVAMITAQNTGLSTIEEGEVTDEELKIETTVVGRLSFGTPPAVQKITRHFKRDGDTLTVSIGMATSNTPLTDHLKATYHRVS